MCHVIRRWVIDDYVMLCHAVTLTFDPSTLKVPSTAACSRVVDGHQMYFGGSVVGKAWTIGIEISPIPPLIFTRSQQVRNLASFSTSLNFEPPAFKTQQNFRTLKQTSCVGMIALCIRQVWSTPRIPEIRAVAPPKFSRRKRAKSSITHRRIIRFRSILCRVKRHDTRSAVKVQGQEVKG